MQEEAYEIAEKDPSVASLPQDDIRKIFQGDTLYHEKLRILPNSITFNFVTLSDSKSLVIWITNLVHSRKSKDRGRLSEA